MGIQDARWEGEALALLPVDPPKRRAWGEAAVVGDEINLRPSLLFTGGNSSSSSAESGVFLQHNGEESSACCWHPPSLASSEAPLATERSVGTTMVSTVEEGIVKSSSAGLPLSLSVMIEQTNVPTSLLERWSGVAADWSINEAEMGSAPE